MSKTKQEKKSLFRQWYIAVVWLYNHKNTVANKNSCSELNQYCRTDTVSELWSTSTLWSCGVTPILPPLFSGTLSGTQEIFAWRRKTFIRAYGNPQTCHNSVLFICIASLLGFGGGEEHPFYKDVFWSVTTLIYTCNVMKHSSLWKKK